MEQTYHLVAELEYWDTINPMVRKEIITKIDEFDSHASAMNYLDKQIIAKMEELRNRGYEPVVKERYAKQWKE